MKRTFMALGIGGALLVGGVAHAQPTPEAVEQDMLARGYTDIVPIEEVSETGAFGFQAVDSDGVPVTIEIQERTGEWLVVRHREPSVIQYFPAGEAPSRGMLVPGSDAPRTTPGATTDEPMTPDEPAAPDNM